MAATTSTTPTDEIYIPSFDDDAMISVLLKMGTSPGESGYYQTSPLVREHSAFNFPPPCDATDGFPPLVSPQERYPYERSLVDTLCTPDWPPPCDAAHGAFALIPKVDFSGDSYPGFAQTPVEQTTVEETPVEQTPVEQTPVQQTPVLCEVLVADIGLLQSCHDPGNSFVSPCVQQPEVSKGKQPQSTASQPSVERRHQCHYCTKKFRQRSSLMAHIRIHTGEKPYACTHCGRRFADYSTFVKHERIHTGDRPYKCNVCGKAFAQSGNMIRHVRTHS